MQRAIALEKLPRGRSLCTCCRLLPRMDRSPWCGACITEIRAEEKTIRREYNRKVRDEAARIVMARHVRAEHIREMAETGEL